MRSYRSGARSVFFDFSSLVIVPVPPRTAATIASASSAVLSRGCAPAWKRPAYPRPGSPPVGSNVASTSQYGSGLNARISSSRRAISASVGVCTRPSETAPSNEERSRIVAARVAFMPTIQSASERERAASSRRA